jgi:HTH-type transcriptional regulator / antitoxin HigA
MPVACTKSTKKISDRYMELVRQFPLRPIKSDAELDAAVDMIDSLVDRPKLSPAEADYLDVLSDIVEHYETEVHPMEPVSDSAMLAHLLEAREVTESEVAKATGIAVSTLSEVVNGKRSLNRGHIGKLAGYFGVAPDVFAF